MRLDEFKKSVVVGSVLEGYKHRTRVVVTAIGTQGFLFVEPPRVMERKSAICNAAACWTIVEGVTAKELGVCLTT